MKYLHETFATEGSVYKNFVGKRFARESVTCQTLVYDREVCVQTYCKG